MRRLYHVTVVLRSGEERVFTRFGTERPSRARDAWAFAIFSRYPGARITGPELVPLDQRSPVCP